MEFQYVGRLNKLKKDTRLQRLAYAIVVALLIILTTSAWTFLAYLFIEFQDNIISFFQQPFIVWTLFGTMVLIAIFAFCHLVYLSVISLIDLIKWIIAPSISQNESTTKEESSFENEQERIGEKDV